MALRYDFDMVTMTPEGLPDAFGDFTASGVEKVAMFRDPQTVAALSRADAAVRTFFTDSGFALQHFDSGAPPDCYPMRDEDARIAIIDKLSSNMGVHDLKGADWGGFEFEAFMDALSRATPIEEKLLAPPPRSAAGVDQELAAARIASQQRKARRMIALGGLILGLILLLYVASQML